MKRGIVAAGLLLVLGVVGWLVGAKERTMSAGRVVLLELAPVDPRSLIQGDYMRLAYRVAREVTVDDWAPDGFVVLRVVDEVGTFARVDDGGALAADEVRMRYRVRQGDLRLGAESFFFEEGSARVFEDARYGELRVAASGEAVLVGLRNGEKKPLRAGMVRERMATPVE